MGVSGKFVLRTDVETPFEVNVSDSKGGRTYLWRRDARVLATLEDADLSSVPTAKLVYADWYDAPSNLRALRAAADGRRTSGAGNAPSPSPARGGGWAAFPSCSTLNTPTPTPTR